MPASRAKRPFAGAAADASQRQLTSFFPVVGDVSSSTLHQQQQQQQQQPLSLAASAAIRLPAKVQADLLSVGMRVRKSVPEGYKTASSFQLWSDDGDGKASSSHTLLPNANVNSRRELLPFCGINRVGGLAFQDDASSFSSSVVPDYSLPSLTLSQETIDDEDEEEEDDDDKKLIQPCQTRKRSLPDDEDDDWSFPDQANTPGWSSANARVKATPRPRTVKGVAGPAEDVGQENMMVDGDFGDADFLVYAGAEQEMDMSR